MDNEIAELIASCTARIKKTFDIRRGLKAKKSILDYLSNSEDMLLRNAETFIRNELELRKMHEAKLKNL